VTPPLIGVTTSEIRRADTITQVAEGEPPQHEMALGMPYVRALERAGAIPVVLPPVAVELVAPLLRGLDAVCLSGGPDIDPGAYGAAPHAELGPVETALDAFELAVARAADAARLPILGICRGCQSLNVARGGSLIQHVPDVVGDTVTHRQSDGGSVMTHDVRVEPGSRLAAALGTDALSVNSFHHQAVERLGEGLRAVAWSADGLIEGVEDDRVLGVQWHAETLDTVSEPNARLFRSFVDACSVDRAVA
jgi:putative glutamine amidotransferase